MLFNSTNIVNFVTKQNNLGMGFTIREANVNDALVIFEMTKKFHEESMLRTEPFTNTLESFIRDCFTDSFSVKFFLAEFKDNVLGYCLYLPAYNVISGPSIMIPDIYIKKEYRGIGVSTFLYSRVFDIAFNGHSNVIKWLVNLKEKNVEVQKRIGVYVDEDVLVLHIDKSNLKSYLDEFLVKEKYAIRLAKTYELPEIFDLINALVIESNRNLQTDIYQLMNAVFSNSMIKILVATENDVVKGFMSFHEFYSTNVGKSLVVDKVFVQLDQRQQKVGVSLLNGVFEYAYNNGYSKVESDISKFEIEKIEGLKDHGIFPYDNVRVARYRREEFEKFYK